MRVVKVEKPDACKMCRSDDFIYIKHHDHFDVERDCIRTDSVWMCTHCECIHFLDGLTECFEYSNTIT